MKAKNVFIATLPRSGSTLVGMILGAHSQICHIGESAYWSKMNVQAAKCCCGAIRCQTLLKISSIISAFPNEIEGIHTACGMIDSMEEPDKVRHSLSLSAPIFSQDMLIPALQMCRIGLEKIADATRTVFGKEIVVENSKYLSIAESLLDQNGNWKVIVVTRDPRGVASCNKEAGERKGVSRPVKDKINLFLSFANRATKMIQRDNVLLVRYEDLCKNTFETLGHMCQFLEVSFEERMLEFKKYKGHLLMGNYMMHDSNQKVQEDLRWRNLLSQEEKRLFMRDDLIQAYARIGYDLKTDF